MKIDPKLFDRYTGRYELGPNVLFTITRDDAHLDAQLNERRINRRWSHG